MDVDDTCGLVVTKLPVFVRCVVNPKNYVLSVLALTWILQSCKPFEM